MGETTDEIRYVFKKCFSLEEAIIKVKEENIPWHINHHYDH